MAQETLKELKYNGSKVIAEVARRDDEGNKIASTYLTDVQIISEDEINAAFETVFGKNTTVKKLLDARKSAVDFFSRYTGTSIDDIIKYNDTSNVTDMHSMFDSCEYLRSVPLLDTSKVTDMGGMFYACRRLKEVPVFNTSKVTDMDGMFYSCESLVIVPALDMSNVTDIHGTHGMFSNCRNIEEIHLLNICTNLDISYCIKMTREALLEVLGNLKDLTGQESKTLTLGSTLLGLLTEEDKLIATNKNWTLA